MGSKQRTEVAPEKPAVTGVAAATVIAGEEPIAQSREEIMGLIINKLTSMIDRLSSWERSDPKLKKWINPPQPPDVAAEAPSSSSKGAAAAGITEEEEEEEEEEERSNGEEEDEEEEEEEGSEGEEEDEKEEEEEGGGETLASPWADDGSVKESRRISETQTAPWKNTAEVLVEDLTKGGREKIRAEVWVRRSGSAHFKDPVQGVKDPSLLIRPELADPPTQFNMANSLFSYISATRPNPKPPWPRPFSCFSSPFIKSLGQTNNKSQQCTKPVRPKFSPPSSFRPLTDSELQQLRAKGLCYHWKENPHGKKNELPLLLVDEDDINDVGKEHFADTPTNFDHFILPSTDWEELVLSAQHTRDSPSTVEAFSTSMCKAGCQDYNQGHLIRRKIRGKLSNTSP